MSRKSSFIPAISKKSSPKPKPPISQKSYYILTGKDGDSPANKALSVM